jgi:hypothetical protein
MKPIRYVVLGFAVTLVVLPLLYRFTGKTVSQNDSAAIGRLHQIGEAEKEYAAKHPDRGYSCDLAALSHESSYSGYKFSLHCSSTSPISGYAVIAQPVEIGKTGLRTYCVTEALQVWYSANNSSSDCFASRRPVPS